MATFGNTNLEVTDSATESQNNLFGLLASPSGDGLITSITTRTRTVSGSGSIKPILLYASDLSIVTNGVGSATAVTSSDTWLTANYSTSPFVEDGRNYYLCYINNNTFGCISKLNAAGGINIVDTSNSYATPTGAPDGTFGTIKRSIYATYSLLPMLTVTNIGTFTATTATLEGNITTLGDATPTTRGFVYSTTPQARPENVAPGSSGYESSISESGSFSTGAFSLNVTDLLPGATYYVRAFAQSTVGYNYSFAQTTLRTGLPSAWLKT